MQILIEKDSATHVPREVKDIEEAKAIGLQFPVYVVADDNSQVPLAAYLAEPEAEEAEESGKKDAK